MTPLLAVTETAPGTMTGYWVTVGAILLLLGYWQGIKSLKRRAQRGTEAQPTQANVPFRDAELDRYARHIMLREIGGPGQKKLKDAKVLVIGAGGLGAPALQYLAAAGVGTIGVIDDDTVENSNLQRQVIHRDHAIGLPKVQSAAEALRAQNPFVDIRPYQRRYDADTAALVEEYDLVLDGSDNFDTRYLVNTHCHAAQTPLISAAITQWEGQISTYNSGENAPCYQCVFPTAPAPGVVPTCAEAGVAAALPGVLGTMMAMEAIKEITGAGQGLTGRLMIYDGLYAESRIISVKKRGDCPVCGGKSTG